MKWLKCMLFGWHALVIWESAGRWPKSHQATTKGSKYFNFKVFGATRIGWGRRLCRVWQPHGSCLQPQLQETLVVGILKGTSEIPFPNVSRVKAPTTLTPATANKGMAKWHALQHDGAGMNKLIHKRPICCHPFWDTNGHTWHYFIQCMHQFARLKLRPTTCLEKWSTQENKLIHCDEPPVVSINFDKYVPVRVRIPLLLSGNRCHNSQLPCTYCTMDFTRRFLA